jgi:hypothetical protein
MLKSTIGDGISIKFNVKHAMYRKYAQSICTGYFYSLKELTSLSALAKD